MKILTHPLAVLFLFMMTPRLAEAQHGLSLGYGENDEDMEVYRLGYQYEWPYKWLETDFGYLTGYHEASISYWHDENNGREGSDGGTVGAYSPVFKYCFGDGDGATFYAEIGVGVSLISDSFIGNSDMSSAFQFEDRIGLGLDMGDHDLVIRFLHYSNASIKPPNSGMDIFLGAYTFRF